MTESFWYFKASWCGPCKHVRESDPYKEAETALDLVEIDIDEKKKKAKKYNIQSVPTLLVVDENNEVKQRKTGVNVIRDRLAREVNDD